MSLPPTLNRGGGHKLPIWPKSKPVLCRFSLRALCPIVAGVAEQLQVIPVERNRWIVDVVRRQFLPVVDLDPRLPTTLTNIMDGGRVCCPAFAPGCRAVKGLGPILSHLLTTSRKIRRAPSRTLFLLCYAIGLNDSKDSRTASNLLCTRRSNIRRPSSLLSTITPK